MFMNSVIDLTAYLPEQPAPRRRKRKFGSIAARGGDCRHPSDGRWLSACPDGVSAGAVKSGFSSSVENSSSSRCARRIQRSVPSA